MGSCGLTGRDIWDFVKRTSGLGFIFITLLIDILGIGLLIPILPDFIAHLTGQNLSEASRDYGWLLALYGAMQFLFSPLLGMLSDRYGRRPVLLLSMLFSGIDYILMAIAPTLLWLYIGRTLSGITGASITAASAYIADVSPPEKRSQNFGLIGAAFGVGFVIGPALGGFLGQWGTRVPFWVAAGLCFANFLYGWFILPESLSVENRRHFVWKEANPLGALRVLGKYPVVWGLTGALVLTNLAMHCVNSTWVLFLMERFGWSTTKAGYSLAAFGVVALVYQLGLARILLPMWGERRTMLIGLAVAAIEFTAYALATHGWMVYAIMILGGVGLLGGQATQGLLSLQVGEDEQGTLQGALTSLASLTGIIGPVIATSLFSIFTREGAPLHIPGISFLLSSVLNVLALLIAARVLWRLRLSPAVAQTADAASAG
jgi:DHA1 family tetracycline resistance protein-like MFS transporter